ncbi:50S ribosomal protein L24 [bacterium]|nr:50S ribosomal protein L24 [Candidatus Elulimicrobium humile]
MKIRKNDIIEVITGKDKGKRGKVIEVIPSRNRVRVEGIMLVKKHQKPRQNGEIGTIIDRPSTIHISNVAFVDSETSTRTKVSYKLLEGKKVRYSHKLNKEL